MVLDRRVPNLFVTMRKPFNVFAEGLVSKMKAEGQGFEPWIGFPMSVFKTDAIGRSATPPIARKMPLAS